MTIRKLSYSVLTLTLLLTVTTAFAVEPTNLAISKKNVRRYHDSGEYVKDLNAVGARALSYLKQRVAINNFHGKKPVIVLDIDETSLSNYDHMNEMDFGGTLKQMAEAQNQATDPAITTTLTLYNYAKAHHVGVIFITGRQENGDRKPTELNLTQAGFQNWDLLILRDGVYKTAPAAVYKTAKRKELVNGGDDILLNMGDQFSDLRGGYADKTFKLPNPFYIIP